MNNGRNKAVWVDCLRRFRVPAGLYVLNMALVFVIFRLYGLETEPFWYAFSVTFFCMAGLFVLCLLKARKKAAALWQKQAGILNAWNDLPAPESLTEADYAEMVRALGREKERLSAAFSAEEKATQDFYTAWVHQIKTPIAVMKLALGSDETPDKRALLEELFRIEQYTDMVLAYQRLGGSSNDLMVREYALDPLVREVIRKFAPQFIYKKLKLLYEGTDLRIVTDRKWLTCILEQLISNAVKYTPAGTVTVSVKNGALTVEDTGVGIAPEDLPRIFERGYTGINGRENGSSSGLGLYLCAEAARLLNIPIRAESEPGKGSRFILDLREKLV